MNGLLQGMDSQVVLVVAAIAVAALVFRLLLRVLNVSTGTVLIIVAIVLGLQYLFGISPQQLWLEISHLPQDLMRMIKSLD